jgi:hypothetical protein
MIVTTCGGPVFDWNDCDPHGRLGLRQVAPERTQVTGAPRRWLPAAQLWAATMPVIKMTSGTKKACSK